MKEVFIKKNCDMYCSKFPFTTRNIKTVSYGTQSLGFLGPKIWSLVPNNLKCLNSLEEFKRKIKKWKIEKCPCRLCKTYIQRVGFVDIET